ncbi:MAG: hypothetical protein DWQ35_06475 [Planctomycetota bacterium]|nr:MAG: hypothetical protein DWQ35_06475 [Planctomycetota bacterium]REK39840.1 MAG: hypothetical protein DWQ46_17545 [Planctomycetota bacterium]
MILERSRHVGPVVEIPVTRTIAKRFTWYTGLAILTSALGLVAIFASVLATLTTVIVLGVLLTLGGLAYIFDTLRSLDRAGFWLNLAAGGLFTVVGGLMIFDPVDGAVGLTLLLAAFFIVEGVLRFVLAGQHSGGFKHWLIGTGFIDLLIGALIVLNWPSASLAVIGIFVGLEMILTGVSMLVARHAQAANPSVAERNEI